MIPGGAALYSALAAAYLGCQARIVTSHAADFVGLPLLQAAGVTVENEASRRTTTFANIYKTGVRESRLLAAAEPLIRPTSADVVFCCPVAGEVAPTAVVGPLVGAGLQGWLRRFGDDGEVHRKPLTELGFLSGCRAAFFSNEDADEPEELARRLSEVVPIVVMTHGAAGADLFTPEKTHLPAHPAKEVDPTGAGDVFAAAFLVALARGQDPVSAGNLAARAGAVAVEGLGATALPRLRGLRMV